MAEKKALILRISPRLWEELRILAERDLRSLNGEIEFLLQEGVRKRAGAAEGERKKGKE